MVKQIKNIYKFILLCCLIILGGCGNSNNNTNSANNTEIQEELSAIEIFGSVHPNKIENIILSFPAQINEVHIKNGQQVNRGEVLITLSTKEAELELIKNTHQLKQARLNLAQIKKEHQDYGEDRRRTYRSLQNQIDVIQLELSNLENEYKQQLEWQKENNDPKINGLEKQIEIAKLDMSQKEEDLNKNKILLDQKSISEKNYKNIQIVYEKQKREVDALKINLKELVFSKEKELLNLELSINQKKSELKNLEIELEKLTDPGIIKEQIQQEIVYSLEKENQYLRRRMNKKWLTGNKIINPFEAAVVTKLENLEGDQIYSGNSICHLIDVNSLIIEADAPEEFINEIKIGAEAEIIPLADRSHTYKGKVIFIGRMASNRNGETVVPVHLSIDNRDDFLLPYLNVDVEIKK
jgi:multidrug resistance efflux pump